MMSDRIRDLYFSSSDGGIEHSISQEDFDHSLIYNLIFEEDGLVIPDIFFFNCKYLWPHLNSQHVLFGRALRDGFIRPAFREEGTETFGQALDIIGTQNVLGIDEGVDARSIAAGLDSYFDCERHGPRFWPPDMGVAFGSLAQQVLTVQAPPLMDERQQSLWAETEAWRTEGLELAASNTRLRGGSGIRRAEIWNAVGRYEGYLDYNKSFDKPYQLATRARERGDFHKLQTIGFFVDLVNLIYQQSQSREFKTFHNIPSALSKQANLVLPVVDSVSNSTLVSHESMIQVPAYSALMNRDAFEILYVKKGPEGARYFAARRAWIANPNDSSRGHELDRAASAYGHALINAAHVPESQIADASLTMTVVRDGVVPLYSVAASDIAIDVAHLSPYYKLVSASLSLAFFTLSLIRGRRKQSERMRITTDDYLLATAARVPNSEMNA